MSAPKGEMPFLDHLEELRWRILWSILAVLVGSAIGIFAVIRLDVIDLLTRPLYAAIASVAEARPDLTPMLGTGVGATFAAKPLTFLNLTEPFFFAIKVGVLVGLLLASPVVIYQVWTFLAPALEARERRIIIPSLFGGLFLFAAGVALAYFVALPLTIRMLIVFASEWFTPSLTAEHYLPFVLGMMITFGVVFELPVVVTILSALGLVTPAFLRAKRRHAMVGMVVVACMMTPGDALGTSIVLLVPLLVLYEVSIVLSSLVRRERVEPLSLLVPLLVLVEGRNVLAATLRRRQQRAAGAHPS